MTTILNWGLVCFPYPDEVVFVVAPELEAVGVELLAVVGVGEVVAGGATTVPLFRLTAPKLAVIVFVLDDADAPDP